MAKAARKAGATVLAGASAKVTVIVRGRPNPLQAAGRDDVDPGHAFYLGYEIAKAVTALTLGKDYHQDRALDWGHLTQPEIGHGPSRAAAEVAEKANAPAT